jgi:Icc-related predicted phosphoesterase
MRILALTDIHGAYDTADEIIRSVSPDVLVVGGDLTTVGSVREAEAALARFSAAVPTVLCVAGNMDLPAHDELFVRLGVSINARGVRMGDVGFCGASGAPHSRLRTPYEIAEEEIGRRLRAGHAELAGCRVVIMVPHAPPFGTRLDIIHAGIHVGSAAVRDAVEDLSPTAVICGHIHEARGVDMIGRTTIVNCGAASTGSYAWIEVADEAVRVELFRFGR